MSVYKKQNIARKKSLGKIQTSSLTLTSDGSSDLLQQLTTSGEVESNFGDPVFSPNSQYVVIGPLP